MKHLIVVFVVVAVAGSAIGQKAMGRGAMIKCPIHQDKRVNALQSQNSGFFADYKGKRYYLCSKACIAKFKKDPAKLSKLTIAFSIPKGH